MTPTQFFLVLAAGGLTLWYCFLFSVLLIHRKDNWKTYVKEQLVTIPILLIHPLYVTFIEIGAANIREGMPPASFYQLTTEWGLFVAFWATWQGSSMTVRALEYIQALKYSSPEDLKRVEGALHCLPKLPTRNTIATLSTLVISVPQGSFATIIYLILGALYGAWRTYYRTIKPLQIDQIAKPNNHGIKQ